MSGVSGGGGGRARRAHPLRSELLRGSAPWAGAAALLAVAIPLWTKSQEWQGSWTATLELLRAVASVFVGPLALAAGCWQGQRELRRRTGDLLAASARGPLARTLMAALPTALWPAGVFLLGAAAALLACLPYTSAGRPDPLAPLADAVFIAAMGLIGYAIGARVRRRLTAPLLGVITPFAFGQLTLGTHGARHLIPYGAEGLMDEAVSVWWQPPAAMVWAGGLAGAAVLAHAARRRYTALVPLAAAVVAGVLIARTGDGMWRPDPLSQRQVCDTSVRPAICVNALHPGMLPEVRDALSRITTRLEGVENLPVRFSDLRRDPGPGEARLPMISPLGWVVVRGKLTDPEIYAREAAQELTGMSASGMGEPCADRYEDERVRAVDSAVVEWLVPRPAAYGSALEWVEAGGDKAEIARARAELKRFEEALGALEGMGGEERGAWLSRYFATVAVCDPSRVPAL
ncbi:hypothetical protein [Streptomyces sp. NPDC001985]|uniref:hypothetical protein n=1 Tax=Streptomyces sp. NPDC001985 TaxID=3154406 RepID=UPI003319CBE0